MSVQRSLLHEKLRLRRYTLCCRGLSKPTSPSYKREDIGLLISAPEIRNPISDHDYDRSSPITFDSINRPTRPPLQEKLQKFSIDPTMGCLPRIP